MCTSKPKINMPPPPPPAPQMPKEQSTAKAVMPADENNDFRGIFRNSLSRLRIPLVT